MSVEDMEYYHTSLPEVLLIKGRIYPLMMWVYNIYGKKNIKLDIGRYRKTDLEKCFLVEV